MEPYSPLIQTALWVAVILCAAWFPHPEIRSLRRALQKRLDAGAPVEFAWLRLGEVRTEAKSTREQMDGMSEQVTALFSPTMSPSMYLDPRKLEPGRCGRFEASDGLRRELGHLRDLGCVEVPGGIRQLPDTGKELGNYATITPTGRDVVKQREASTSR